MLKPRLARYRLSCAMPGRDVPFPAAGGCTNEPPSADPPASRAAPSFPASTIAVAASLEPLSERLAEPSIAPGPPLAPPVPDSLRPPPPPLLPPPVRWSGVVVPRAAVPAVPPEVAVVPAELEDPLEDVLPIDALSSPPQPRIESATRAPGKLRKSMRGARCMLVGRGGAGRGSAGRGRMVNAGSGERSYHTPHR